MPEFKKLIDNEIIDGRYARKVIVFVESADDVEVYQDRWFSDEMEWLEFKSVDEGAGGGCNEVIGKVAKHRANQLLAFGIVDRDALLSRNIYDLFWETDDGAYNSAQPFGERISILCRWEMENYLLDADELEYILADKSNPHRPIREKLQMIQELLSYCDTLIPVVAANVLFHENQCGALDLCFRNEIESRPEMEIAVRQAIEQKLGSPILERFMENIERVIAFAENHPEGCEERWERLIRIIDGKRILNRIQLKNRLKDDIKRDLARRIKRAGSINPEFMKLIGYFRQQYEYKYNTN